MGKTFPLTSVMIPAPANGIAKGTQALQTLSDASSMPSTPGPAQPLPQALTLPTSFGDAAKRVQDAFTAVKVMNATRKGDGKTALDALNGR